MKNGDNLHILAADSIDQPVVAPQNFTNDRVAKLWNYSTGVWEHREPLHCSDEPLRDQTGVVR